MNNSTSTPSIAMMTPWLHFGNTDYLIFQPWHPSSHGAVAGACVGLLLFSILERCLAAYRRAQELHWRTRITITLPPNKAHPSSKADDTETSTGSHVAAYRHAVPSFIPSHDIPRGVIQAVQSTFSYALMLTVMTFNGAYIISAILGLGVGEILFGPIGRRHEA